MSANPLKSQNLKIWLAVVWLAFTLAMVLWWWSLGLAEMPDHTKYRMMMWEGAFFVLATLSGGSVLIWLLLKDQERHHQIKTFFATFSHDLKTSISRLRLQADVMKESGTLRKDPSLERLAQDIYRLDLQLENSLILAQGDQTQLLIEEIRLSNIIPELKNELDSIEIELERDAILKIDRRSAFSVLRNLLSNSVQHGEASVIRIHAKPRSNEVLTIRVEDNGKGDSRKKENLGRLPLGRPATGTSSNGLGLYLSRSLMQKQKGNLSFEDSRDGFVAVLEVPGRLL